MGYVIHIGIGSARRTLCLRIAFQSCACTYLPCTRVEAPMLELTGNAIHIGMGNARRHVMHRDCIFGCMYRSSEALGCGFDNILTPL